MPGKPQDPDNLTANAENVPGGIPDGRVFTFQACTAVQLKARVYRRLLSGRRAPGPTPGYWMFLDLTLGEFRNIQHPVSPLKRDLLTYQHPASGIQYPATSIKFSASFQ
jgi:hypothetical protein